MKWEYQVVRVVNALGVHGETVALDEEGAKGWELVSVTVGDRFTWFYFKRAIT